MWRQRAIQIVVYSSGKSQNHGASFSSSFSSFRLYSDFSGKGGKLAPLQERRMVDRVRIWAKGGDGGSGCWSVRRSRTDRHGKPDGGNGGKGGDVVLECAACVWDFSNLQHHLNAKRGGNGTSKNKVGTRGADKVVQVPIGTVIHLVQGEVPFFQESSCSLSLQPWEIPDESEQQNDNQAPSVSTDPQSLYFSDSSSTQSSSPSSSSLSSSLSSSSSSSSSSSEEEEEEEEENCEEMRYSVAELMKPGQRIVVARGGEGGLGSYSAGRASKPPENAGGATGSEAILILELKSIAQVGLVGLPNAGKSTLLGAISRAKPVVGDYPFTTLRPNIGNVEYEDFVSMTVADIPGIIKGAHENRGLGHAFLRHIERTKVLAYVLDLAAEMPPWEQLRDLARELECYEEGMTMRPSLVVANKADVEGAEAAVEELRRRVQGVHVYAVSAVLEEGVELLKLALRSLADDSGSDAKFYIKILDD